ncbi:MAG: cell division protein ZapA [Sphingomonadales bacterium]|nr:cell division protein ZapA [Sphingomonadales bacterium]
MPRPVAGIISPSPPPMEHSEIQVQIGSRSYPLRAPAHELERLRQAESLLNERLTDYKAQHPGADRFDLMGMTAFFLAHSLIQPQEHTPSDSEPPLDTEQADPLAEEELRQRLEALEASLNRILHSKASVQAI